jgi:hypothetical protein
MAWSDMTQLTGLVAWYKPETLAATYANGDPISTWADSSGNSRDLTGTTTTRPLAAANAFGTYMAADFDGTDDVLSSASYSHSGQIVVSFVLSIDALKNYNAPFVLSDDSPPVYPNALTVLGYSNGNYLVGTQHTTGQALYAQWYGALATTTNYIMTVSANGNSGMIVGLNGRRYADLATFVQPLNTPTQTSYIYLGYGGLSNSYLNGKICEVVAYNVSDDSEIPWVEGYLANKYSITLADGHLFKNAAPENAPTTYNAAGGGSSRLINGGLVD